MSDAVVFASISIDGTEELCVCDGTDHYRVVKPWFSDEEPYAGRDEPCDGSCKPRDWKEHILEQIENVRGSTIRLEDDVVLPSHVEITPEAQEILDQGEIIGVRISDWYAKRCGEGETYRLSGGRYLVLSTRFNWWSCDSTGRFQTIKVTVERPSEDTGVYWCDYVLGDDETRSLVDQAFINLQRGEDEVA